MKALRKGHLIIMIADCSNLVWDDDGQWGFYFSIEFSSKSPFASFA